VSPKVASGERCVCDYLQSEVTVSCDVREGCTCTVEEDEEERERKRSAPSSSRITRVLGCLSCRTNHTNIALA
jgi:hypothetical protein